MRVVISGQSGLNKYDYTEKLRKYIEDKGQSVALFHIGKRMCKELDISEEKILNSKLKQLDLVRQLVFEKIFKEIEREKPENIILNTHLVF